jgi:integrase/recombinase XerD
VNTGALPPPQHRALAPTLWPLADRCAWEAANEQAAFLAAGGHGATWRPASRRSARGSYARWLGWLTAEGVALDAEAPAARITPERIKAYVGYLQQGRASVTVPSYLGVLYMAVRAMFPGSDWSSLLRLQARMKRLASPSRGKQTRIVPVHQLVQLGLDLTVRAGEILDRHKEIDLPPQRLVAAARDYRDGLMIALLASRPLRSKNMLQIEIGGHLRRSATRATLSFLASETKDKRAYATVWPTQLLPELDRYLSLVRPILIGAHAPYNPAYPKRPLGAILWAAQGGTPLSACGLLQAVARHTLPRFGHTITAHLFRDCAATTLANEDPNHVRYAAKLLGHHALRTTEQNYISANSEVALDRHHDTIASMRLSARQRHRNRAENVE